MTTDYLWLRLITVLEEIRDRLPAPKPVEEPITAICQHCMEVFKVGPGTGRRMDAIFCSDEHRVRFHSLKRSPKTPADSLAEWEKL